MDTVELESRYTSGVHPKRDIAIVRGQGAHLWDESGRVYIDCVGGHGVALLGHGNTALAEAIATQAHKLITCPEIFHNDVRARLMEKLASLAPGNLERVFLCNSGTEAVEAALKFARVSTARPGVVATVRGFHGRTLGALSATWEPKYREPYEPLLPGFSHVPYNNSDALRAAVTDSTAAVVLEIVQGEGGVHLGTPEYLADAVDICRRTGALLIVDEVQTGFGRTGRLFACQHQGIEPDLLCLAKGIAGGVPMGAVLIGSNVKNLAPGVHGTTFGGNPLACAAALAAIDLILESDLAGQAARKGAWALQQLRRIDTQEIREVRGLGLMIGIELRHRVTPYLKKLMDQGILALPAGKTVLRLLPPLVISDDDLATVCDAIRDILTGE